MDYKKLVIVFLLLLANVVVAQQTYGNHEVPEEEEQEEKVIPFSVIERVPVYPGCDSKLNNADLKKCFSAKMSKHIARKFDADLAQNLGLEAGFKKIYVIFTISKDGIATDFKVKAPHNELKKEAIRAMKLLPQMKPGVQRGKNVSVNYVLPIKVMVTGDYTNEIDSLQIKLSNHDKEEMSWMRIGKLRREIDKEILKNTKISDTIRLKYDLKVDSIGRVRILNNKINEVTLKTNLKKITNKEYKVSPFITKGIRNSITSDRYNLYLLDEKRVYKAFFPKFSIATFEGCIGDSKALKRCMNSNINKHISKNFNSDLANDLGLQSGRQRIIVSFEITKEGGIEKVIARAPHHRLRLEGERVIKLLPTLVPAVYDGKKIKTKYSVPIVFVVEESSPRKTKKQLKAEKKRLKKALR